MFNTVHHHCHLFTDFYKKFICPEFKLLFIVRQIKQLHPLEGLFVGRSRWFRPTFQCNTGTLHFNNSKNMFTFQRQQNPMEIPSGVHGGFKITNPNKFSDVHRILKPWLTMLTINFRTYPTVFPTEKNKILFAISYFDKTGFNWVQPRLDFFWKTKTKNKSKKRNKCFCDGLNPYGGWSGLVIGLMGAS